MQLLLLLLVTSLFVVRGLVVGTIACNVLVVVIVIDVVIGKPHNSTIAVLLSPSLSLLPLAASCLVFRMPLHPGLGCPYPQTWLQGTG
jgi:hypothetical protein